MNSLDLAFGDSLEVVFMTLIEEVIGVKAQPHLIIALNQPHHFFSVLTKAGAWKIFHTQDSSDLLSDRSKFSD